MARKTVKQRTRPKKKTLDAGAVKVLAEIERLAEHALASGPATLWTTQDKEDILRRLREKYGNCSGRRS
jgi:hypothetical protein